MKKYLIILLAISWSSFAIKKPEVVFSGDVDLQTKQLYNPESSENNGQVWKHDTESFSMAIANMDLNVHTEHHQLDAHWFLRYSKSPLYKDDYYAAGFANFPTDLMSRDVFKFSKVDTGEDTITESIVNRFVYTWRDDESAFKIGRLWIQYGDGLVFNPINPFNVPFTFSTTSDIVQGNDGMEFQFLSDPRLKLYLYLLGDKEFYGYDDGRISRTIMLRGDYDYSEKLNIIYILGEDQKRHKYGAELKYSLPSGFLLGQFVKNTRRLDKSAGASESLSQYVIAIEQDLTSIWSIRLEGGKNDRDELAGFSLYERYMLPQENFIALLNSLEISDKFTTQINLSSDVETRFTFGGLRISYQMHKYLELHAFASSALTKDEEKAQEENQLAQLYVPSQFGAGLRAAF